jgi:hypothetical protein
MKRVRIAFLAFLLSVSSASVASLGDSECVSQSCAWCTYSGEFPSCEYVSYSGGCVCSFRNGGCIEHGQCTYVP